MHASVSRSLLAAALALAFANLAAKEGASGTVTVEGESWKIADATAVLDDDEVELVFSPHPWNRAAWADDGEFGTFDLMEFDDGGSHSVLSVDVNAEGKYGGHSVRHASGSSGGYSSDHESSITITSRTAERIAGTLKMQGDDVTADVAFDLALVKEGPLARAGQPLPADGGEPGKALQAVVAATHAGDVAKMTALSNPERRAGIEEAKKAGQLDQMLAMAKLFTPKIKKITGGTVDGDKAWVEFVGDEGGSETKGTATMTRVNGSWYLDEIQTRSGS